MESYLVGSFPHASSITTGGNLLRSKANNNIYHASSYVPKSSQHKWKAKKEYPVSRSRMPCLNNHYKYTEGLSTYQEDDRKYSIKTSLIGSSFESEPHAADLQSSLDSAKKFLVAFYRFSTPYSYATIAKILYTASISLLAVEKSSDMSLLFFTGLLKVVIPQIFMGIYLNGVNQLYDIEIDKINKPHLPLASGQLSYTTAVFIMTSSLILSCCLAWIFGSQPLNWNLMLSFMILTAYSINVPLLRWKGNPILAAMTFTSLWGFIYPITYFLHMQTFVFKRPAVFPRSLAFVHVLLSFYFVGISFLKDIPDIEGDKKFGIHSFSMRFGKKRVFWICVSLLEMAFGVGLLVGATSSCLSNRIVTVLGHAVLASVLGFHAKFVDLESNASTMSFYKLVWKLLYAECFLIPFLR
uniref:PT2 protein n=2 Tax=Lotus japonicus TaxID=34305 RepID=A0A218L3K8_LOTJA|nr:PT2 protein [Lotus japonicus]